MKRDLGLILAGATLPLLIVASSIKTDGNIETGGQLVSTANRGTPPLAVTSDDWVRNLNADQLDGMDSGDFALEAETYSTAEVDALVTSVAAAAGPRYFYITDFVYPASSALSACQRRRRRGTPVGTGRLDPHGPRAGLCDPRRRHHELQSLDIERPERRGHHCSPDLVAFHTGWALVRQQDFLYQ